MTRTVHTASPARDRPRPVDELAARRPFVSVPGDPTGDIDEVLGWPRRTALLVGEHPHTSLMTVLHTLGFSTAVAGVDQMHRVGTHAAPFTFCVFGPEVFDGRNAIEEQVAALHRLSPASRMLLDTRPDDVDSSVVIRAMRAGVVDVLDGTDPESIEESLALGLSVMGRQRERVLAVGAHPDDVEIGCAGTLLDHRLRGDRITILTLSRGAVGGDRLARLAEATATAESIGAQLVIGDLPDTAIDAGISTIRLIEEVVAAIDPTVVYVHSAHDGHQDHRAVSAATASATRRVRRVYAYQSPSATNEYKPSRFVAVDHVLQRKVQVLMMFDSQNGRTYLEPELIVAGSRYWARHLGANARYAEPFEVIRSVGDLRQAVTGEAPATTGRLAFGLPGYESAAIPAALGPGPAAGRDVTTFAPSTVPTVPSPPLRVV